MESLIVFAIVAAAVLFVGRRMYATLRSARRKDAGCAGGCGCSADRAAGSRH